MTDPLIIPGHSIEEKMELNKMKTKIPWGLKVLIDSYTMQYDVDIDMIIQENFRCRKQEIVKIRWSCLREAAKMGFTNGELTRFFNVHHSSVYYALSDKYRLQQKLNKCTS